MLLFFIMNDKTEKLLLFSNLDHVLDVIIRDFQAKTVHHMPEVMKHKLRMPELWHT